MAKEKILWVCQGCGSQSAKWLGRCPDCGEWNTLIEERAGGSVERKGWPSLSSGGGPTRISDLHLSTDDRLATGIGEFDRVLGGGIVRGSLALIGGDPGIGKSTLLLQALRRIADEVGEVLYVSGEESPAQIKMRGERTGVSSRDLFLLSETSLEEILRYASDRKPRVLVIDSIQTVFTSHLTSAPGSVSQIRETAAQLLAFAKGTGTPTFLIGHVTKEGSIAGPRVLEHIVDTVLYFEGDKGQPTRILRAVKNRFGSTNEIGVFEMKEAGLEEVANPSEMFLAEKPLGASGSVVVGSMEGTRPILVELQALVSPSYLAMPRRMAMGVDVQRASLLVAVLEKRGGLHLSSQDVFINVVGGLHLEEPGIDLGIVAAVASSLREKPVDSRTLIFGEVGLAGEVRAIAHAEMRVNEGARLGFTKCILPQRSCERLPQSRSMEMIAVGHVKEAIEAALG